MADLLSTEMIADLIINIINILILFFVSKKLLYKPVKKMLDARKEKALALSTDAKTSIERARKTQEEYNELLAKAETEKNAVLEKAREQADESAESIIAAAEKHASEIVSEAKAKALREREKAVTDAKKDIVDAAIEISEKILHREVQSSDNKELIESFFAEQENI